MTKVRIVVANGFICGYPQGGGVWTVFLQYILGLRALGHDILFLEITRATGDREHDDALVAGFFERMRAYGVADHCVVLRLAQGIPITFSSSEIFGKTRNEVAQFVASADLLWNLCGILSRSPMMSSFKRRVLVDLDPGHLQVSALSCDMGLEDHHGFLTVGANLHAPSCEAPTLGFTWRPFLPFVYLPMWTCGPGPPADASFTSITQWSWGELHLGGRVLSISKRDAYLRYLDLPRRANTSFELAANLHYRNPSLDEDRELLTSHGWTLVDPNSHVSSPAAYQSYISSSKAEISCPKPIFRELRTGWVSDRSACYLASGRPVLAEDTGFSDILPTGEGLLSFSDMVSAVAGVSEVNANYARHSLAARKLAVEYLASDKVLEQMIEDSFR